MHALGTADHEIALTANGRTKKCGGRLPAVAHAADTNAGTRADAPPRQATAENRTS
jgi:hypothetical protein